MAQEEKGEKTIWVERGRKWVREAWSNKKLNEVYMDVGLMGEPHQVSAWLWFAGLSGYVQNARASLLTPIPLPSEEMGGSSA